MRQRLHWIAKTAPEWLGWSGIAFLALAILYLALGVLSPNGVVRDFVFFGLLIAGVWAAVRVLRRAAKSAIWRLRNRLLVTYLFIAAVPILLVAALAYLGGRVLVDQLAIYMVTSQLDRRIDTLASFTDSVVRTDPVSRPVTMERSLDLFYRDRFPDIEILLRENGHEIRYPEGATIPAPLAGWQPTHGVLIRNHRFYLWSYAKTQAGDVTAIAPLSSEFLANLVPRLGHVDVTAPRLDRGSVAREAREFPPGPPLAPSRFGRLDPDFRWIAVLDADDWDQPGKTNPNGLLLSVHTRVSQVLAEVFSRKDLFQRGLVFALLAAFVVFLVVEAISVVIGIGFTRTITGAVQRLYEGTRLVMAGDFSHRIEVSGNDQLAELGKSFNRMTEHLEQLLAVAKEKERLESEIEIAREVQNQLFPREIPSLRTLRIQAVCQPARLVSGDYYDFETVGDSEVALAIADVAGKGISAALLMAALQSSLRAQLQARVPVLEEVMAGGGNGHHASGLSTSRLVSNLNQQLYSMTSAEKYATFCLGLYEESSSTFTYTNAGHLAPLLIRDGRAEGLDVNGTVVGAFAFSQFSESRITLRSGDLLAFYTDGVTEPENEYGEMFGEARLTELLVRNANRPEDQIIAQVLESVRQWTASEELQDDMTLLLARRV